MKKKKEVETHSSYWLNPNNEEPAGAVERLLRLASARRAVGNFVSILTGDPTIKVQFSSGKNSFTDGKFVVISADDNPEKFDSIVGLALHEGAHCLLSNFDMLRDVFSSVPKFYGSIHEELRAAYPYDTLADEGRLIALRETIKTVMNVIEDRRIDSYIYTRAQGYRPYYDALYNTHFTNKEVQKSMRSDPAWREPTIENYINWLILMYDENFDRSALPALGEMVDMIDLPNIRRFDTSIHSIAVASDAGEIGSFHAPDMTGNTVEHSIFNYNQFPLLWRVANEITLKILKYAKLHAEKSPDSCEMLLDNIKFELGDTDPNALPNLDLPAVKFNKERTARALEKIKSALSGGIKKRKISMHDQQQLDAMESANVTMNETTDARLGKVQCMVTRNLTKSMLAAEWFPFSRVSSHAKHTTAIIKDADQGVRNGIRMGQILAHRLQVRNDPVITHFTRQPHGKIDRRLLSQLGMDITSVFKRTTVDNFTPALLFLTLDASGSMGGQRWTQCVTVATALAYAAEKITNLDVVISIRGNVQSGLPIVAIIYDSRKDRFQKVRSLFPYLCPTGSTPEGLCYAAVLDLMQEYANQYQVYFVNFSDGEPGCDYTFAAHRTAYFGEVAIAHTRRMVSTIKNMGISVLSYFINDARSASRKQFSQMYGDGAEFIDVRQVTQVLTTINKLLLSARQ
jgi:hypothetical protein